MPADNRAALAAATRDRSHKARVQARTAIRRLDRDRAPITFASVAATAGVSRSLLYRDPALRAEIERLRATTATEGRCPPAAERSTDASLKQRLAAALDDNRAFRDENAKLRKRIAALLGEQRTANITSRPQHDPSAPAAELTTALSATCRPRKPHVSDSLLLRTPDNRQPADQKIKRIGHGFRNFDKLPATPPSALQRHLARSSRRETQGPHSTIRGVEPV
ncbi:MAG: DUF6262 family protein [Egibacteraceae bacterium]